MRGTVGDEAAPLVGRDQEQSLLGSILDEVATRGQALVLSGEPGVGKSRMLAYAVRTARERGMSVLTATGVQRAALDAAFGLTHEAAPEHRDGRPGPRVGRCRRCSAAPGCR